MPAFKPVSKIVAVPAAALSDGEAITDFAIFNAYTVRVVNNTDQPILVARCLAQGADTNGDAFSVSVDAGYGEGGLILNAGDTVNISKAPGRRLWDDEAGEWVQMPPESYWGETIYLDDAAILGTPGTDGDAAPTTGFVYLSAVSTVY